MAKFISFPAAMVFFQFLALTTAPLAQNQQPAQGGNRFQPNPDRMVERLNRELTLNADQQKKIKAIYEKAFKSMAAPGDSGATGAAARRQRMAQQTNVQNDFRKRMEQTNAEIKKVLTPEQQKKFDAMPMGGGRGMGMNVADRITRLDERLKLTADQKKKLTAIFEKQNQDSQKMFEQMRQQGDQQANRDAMRETMQKIRDKNNKEIEAVLTADQKKQYEAMQTEQLQQRQQRQQQGGGNNQQR